MAATAGMTVAHVLRGELDAAVAGDGAAASRRARPVGTDVFNIDIFGTKSSTRRHRCIPFDHASANPQTGRSDRLELVHGHRQLGSLMPCTD